MQRKGQNAHFFSIKSIGGVLCSSRKTEFCQQKRNSKKNGNNHIFLWSLIFDDFINSCIIFPNSIHFFGGKRRLKWPFPNSEQRSILRVEKERKRRKTFRMPWKWIVFPNLSTNEVGQFSACYKTGSGKVFILPQILAGVAQKLPQIIASRWNHLIKFFRRIVSV